MWSFPITIAAIEYVVHNYLCTAPRSPQASSTEPPPPHQNSLTDHLRCPCTAHLTARFCLSAKEKQVGREDNGGEQLKTCNWTITDGKSKYITAIHSYLSLCECHLNTPYAHSTPCDIQYLYLIKALHLIPRYDSSYLGNLGNP